MKKKVLTFICVLAIAFVIGLDSILAVDCSKCSTANCSACEGCKLYKDSGGYNYCMPISDIELLDNLGSCAHYTTEDSCKHNKYFSCLWIENEDAPNKAYCNVDNLLYVGCGDASDIPLSVPAWTSLLINLLKIATPIILIFMSILSLFKALASQKEDEIKKVQSSLIKKIIAAVLIFFVIAIVQFVISKVAEDDEYNNFTDCMDCFINNKCSQSTYYRTVAQGVDFCTPLTTGKTVECKTLFK